MNGIIRKFALPCIAVAFFVSPSQGHAACLTSLGSLNGWYGLLISGSTTATTPAAKYVTGALLFNGAGGVSATHVYSGTATASTATGSYVVNADCTVSLLLTVGGAAVQTYTVALTQTNEAVGIETDASAVAKIDLQAQYATVTTGLNFTASSLNGTFSAGCVGPATLSSDLNIVTFTNGTLKGTDPYNNSGAYAVANNPYTGTYTINSDGTFAGALSVGGTPFDFYGVISSSGAKVEYIYSNVSNGVPTGGFASCTGKSAAAVAY